MWRWFAFKKPSQMRDFISIERVNKLHPKIKDEVETTIEFIERGFPNTIAVRVVQGFRTFAEQDQLYALGRTIKNPDGARPGKPMGNKVTNAKGGHSYHNYGLALDFAIMYDKNNDGKYETLSWDLLKDLDRDGEADWQEVVKAFKSLSYTWGGDWTSFKDNPHIQKVFNYDIATLLKKYNNKFFIPGTTYVSI